MGVPRPGGYHRDRHRAAWCRWASTKTIQPFETGVVSAIRVADGDHVRAGQVLIEVDPTQALADRDHFQRDLLQAQLDMARLRGIQRMLDHGEPRRRRRWPMCRRWRHAEDVTLAGIKAARAAWPGQAAKLSGRWIEQVRAETVRGG